jgi:hypothetical protein
MIAVPMPGLPGPTTWQNEPQSAWIAEDGLHIVAPPLSDLFIDPRAGGETAKADSPILLVAADPLFTLSAHVQVDFASTFDAGVLVIWAGDRHWAKLCFEYSPQAEPMIVSVVTNGVSDDCNSVVVDGSQVYLRVTRLEHAYAFHFSHDATKWRLVRYFALHTDDPVSVGLSSQSPTGQGCHVRFREIRYATEVVRDLRSGA